MRVINLWRLINRDIVKVLVENEPKLDIAKLIVNNKRTTIIIAIVVVLVVAAGLGFWLRPTTDSNKTTHAITIKRSEIQGDYVRDERTPEEACNPLLSEVKSSNPNLNCRLTDSKRIDDYLPDECVDGISVAGCFACTFECE